MKRYGRAAAYIPWALGALLAWIIVANFIWLRVDRSPSDMDQGRYMLMVKDFADGLVRLDAGFVASLVVGNHPSHPHLVPLLASVPFMLFNRSEHAAYTVNTLAYAGIAVLIFRITTRLANRRAGLLGALLGAGLPPIARFSRLFVLEEAVAFFVILGLFLLLESDGLQKARWTLALGAVLGLAAITKWTAVVFLSPPLLLVGVGDAMRTRTLRPLGALAVTLGAATLVAGPWYFHRWQSLLLFVRYAEEGRGFAASGPGLGQLADYVWGFGQSSGWPFAILGFVGLASFVIRPTRDRIVLLAAVLVPTAVFSFAIHSSDLRHLLPSFPVIAVAAAVGLAALRPAPLRQIVAAAAAVLALVSVHQSAWGLAGHNGAVLLTGRSMVVLPAAHPPDSRDWKFAELLDVVRRDFAATVETTDRRATVRVVAGNLPFRPNGFAFLAAERFPTTWLTHVPFYYSPGNPQHVHLGTRSLLRTDYLLIRDGDINGNTNRLLRYSRALQRYLARKGADREGLFRQIHTTTLPGGLTARVLRGSGISCGAAMLDYLDWAHATDADDPGVVELVETCSGERTNHGETWTGLLHVLRPRPAAGERSRSTALRLLVAARPDVRWCRRLLGESLAEEGLTAEAARAHEDIGPGAPYECSALIEAGGLWRRLGRLDQARLALVGGVSDTPDCVAGHRQLAAVERALGNLEAAAFEEGLVALLEGQERLGAGADTARYRLAMGDVARRAGRVIESRHHYRRALENEPENDEARLRLEALGDAP